MTSKMKPKTKKIVKKPSKSVKCTGRISGVYLEEMELYKAEIEDLNAERKAAKVKYNLRLKALDEMIEDLLAENLDLLNKYNKAESKLTFHTVCDVLFAGVVVLILSVAGAYKLISLW